jgi:cytochrome oxidase assembly protein ShyY1
VLFVVAACVGLGVWQLARNNHKHDLVRARKAAYAAPAPNIETAGTSLTSGDRVEAHGTYDAKAQALLRNQVRNGTAGFDVLTPMRLRDGTGVVVDRGWIGTGDVGTLRAPPTGDVVVRGLLRESRPLGSTDEVREINGITSIPSVGVDALQRNVTYELSDKWIEAQYQQPAPGADAPLLPEPPAPDPVNHMQYAIEWFAFAAVPLIGWPIVCRRALRRQEGP